MSAILTLASSTFAGLSTFYTLREYYLPLMDQHAKDKDTDAKRIQALEEEIVRLKREIRICGISVPVLVAPYVSSKNNRT